MIDHLQEVFKKILPFFSILENVIVRFKSYHSTTVTRILDYIGSSRDIPVCEVRQKCPKPAYYCSAKPYHKSQLQEGNTPMKWIDQAYTSIL